MAYDIANMRAELQEHISPRYSDGTVGESIRKSFKRMEISNRSLAERSRSKCLIPQVAENGGALSDCPRATANSHAIQEKVLQRIATDANGKYEVLDFMDINTSRIADECRGPDGELWHKKPWDIERLPPRLVPITTASARHFACNSCDNATFRLVEDTAIPWPSWPDTVIVDDLRPNQTQNNLTDQLFLLAYRCLLQHISHFRGLIAADKYAASDQSIDDTYREVLMVREPVNQRILNKLGNFKTKYDRRLTGMADLPMVHLIVPVVPAFPIASTAFTPYGNNHVATTVYPEDHELASGTTELRHWMVISTEAQHGWALRATTQAIVAAAQHTTQDTQSSIDWTVKRIGGDGSLSTYANPDSYREFCEQHPAVSDQIERLIPDTIVVEYYERHIGNALCTV